jgi:hypothetical protein
LKKGDWALSAQQAKQQAAQDELWERTVLETGDPSLWPDIEQRYREDARQRSSILAALSFHWQEHAALVTPLIEEALQDPELFEPALLAASGFPELAGSVAAAIRRVLLHPDPHWRWRALENACFHPEHGRALFVALQNLKVRTALGPKIVLGALATVLGIERDPYDLTYYAPPAQQAVREQVEAALRERFGLDPSEVLQNP